MIEGSIILNIKVKKYLIVFITTFAWLVITAGGFSATNALADKCYQAEVTDISGSKYFPAVEEALARAEKSIDMVMYQVNLRPYDKSSQVYSLVDELIKAHKRGVKVKIILDQNIDFVGERGVNRWVTEGKNSWCFKILKDAGMDVNYDDLTTYTHAKVLVIDDEMVISGSSNWTDGALRRNFEVNTLIKSKELAGEILKSFSGIKIGERASTDTQTSEGGVIVSWKFLENPRLVGRIITRHYERAFDLYLALLKEFNGNSEGNKTLDYEKTAGYLGLADKMTREGYRRQINRSLKKLKDEYSLIDFELHYDKDAEIRLLDYDNPENPYSEPKEWYFRVPNEYWEYGWASRLSHSAKFCYLINLAYANVSNAFPWWFSSVEVLSKRFNVSKWVIIKGMQELRIANLIDVAYDMPKAGNYASRLAKSYKILPLYNPAWLESEWDRLEAAYGVERRDDARRYAKIVFKQNDPQVIEDIILSVDVFGKETVKKAFDIVARKRVDNSKRCYQYVKATIERMEDSEPGL